MVRRDAMGAALLAAATSSRVLLAQSDSSCCVVHARPGCDIRWCEDAVCNIDPFCCDVQWDAICLREVNDLCADICGSPPCPGAGDCCIPNGGPGCNDAACCWTVCAADPFCCEAAWDGICAREAVRLCPLCSCPAEPRCPADVDGDAIVDAADLGVLLGAWGGADPCADLNADGIVDGADLAVLLGAWGPCPS